MSPLSQLSSKADSTATINTFHVITCWNDMPAGRSHTRTIRTRRNPTRQSQTTRNGRRRSRTICPGRTEGGRSSNFVEKQPHHHNYQMPSQMQVGGVSGLDIACNLETSLVARLGEAAWNRRLQLSGNEAGNGLEMWRQQYSEFKGNGELIEASGRKLLNNFPQCKSMEHLSEHFDKAGARLWARDCRIRSKASARHAYGSIADGT